MRSAHLLFLAALPLSAVGAQQPTSITLSCSGTSKLMATAAANFALDPIADIGIIVNFTNHSVTFSEYTTPVTGVNATLVSFSGRQTLAAAAALGLKDAQFTIDGSIDRVTGHTEIDWMCEVAGNNSHWDLMCRPTTSVLSYGPCIACRCVIRGMWCLP